ncbi:MAG: hypothetical protein OXF07_01270 [Rhodobacter sp.]|nr:hypothetical protein [Rhodobacter sp.]MCY4169241.1 hypothetical protein [Rhodobacter sp.]MCY4240938.1 hypothetical protein [Rhodobacter sp.]
MKKMQAENEGLKADLAATLSGMRAGRAQHDAALSDSIASAAEKMRRRQIGTRPRAGGRRGAVGRDRRRRGRRHRRVLTPETRGPPQ